MDIMSSPLPSLIIHPSPYTRETLSFSSLSMLMKICYHPTWNSMCLFSMWVRDSWSGVGLEFVFTFSSTQRFDQMNASYKWYSSLSLSLSHLSISSCLSICLSAAPVAAGVAAGVSPSLLLLPLSLFCLPLYETLEIIRLKNSVGIWFLFCCSRCAFAPAAPVAAPIVPSHPLLPPVIVVHSSQSRYSILE